VSDIADEAQAVEEAERERALQALRRDLAWAPPFETADCVDCGDDIPAARRKAVPHARRCTGCQSVHERSVR
jgi:phage/conjugal plasmid C-4 type zinc finger TraR family protein